MRLFSHKCCGEYHKGGREVDLWKPGTWRVLLKMFLGRYGFYLYFYFTPSAEMWREVNNRNTNAGSWGCKCFSGYSV